MRENLAVVSSSYDDGVELIREFKELLHLQKSDMEFAVELIQKAPQERWNLLEELIADSFDPSLTSLTEYLAWISKLEEIKNWTPK